MEDGGFTMVTRQRKRKKGRSKNSKPTESITILSGTEMNLDIKSLVNEVSLEGKEVVNHVPSTLFKLIAPS